MNLLRHPAFYLIGSNLLLWGIPLAVIQFQGSEGLTTSADQEDVRPTDVSSPVQIEQRHLALSSHDRYDHARSLPGQQHPSQSLPALPKVVRESLPVAATVAAPDALPIEHTHANVMEQLRGADGLGGPITLASLHEPQMPIAARAERMQQKRSGDPLAALPRHWRDSLRQGLASGPVVSEATMVRLPVPALKEREELAVVVNERGEGDGLAAPRDARVRAAVESWASRQAPSSPGTVQVYVVAAEPLPVVTP